MVSPKTESVYRYLFAAFSFSFLKDGLVKKISNIYQIKWKRQLFSASCIAGILKKRFLQLNCLEIDYNKYHFTEIFLIKVLRQFLFDFFSRSFFASINYNFSLSFQVFSRQRRWQDLSKLECSKELLQVSYLDIRVFLRR